MKDKYNFLYNADGKGKKQVPGKHCYYYYAVGIVRRADISCRFSDDTQNVSSYES